jgi:hypothetical protein
MCDLCVADAWRELKHAIFDAILTPESLRQICRGCACNDLLVSWIRCSSRPFCTSRLFAFDCL